MNISLNCVIYVMVQWLCHDSTAAQQNNKKLTGYLCPVLKIRIQKPFCRDSGYKSLLIQKCYKSIFSVCCIKDTFTVVI